MLSTKRDGVEAGWTDAVTSTNSRTAEHRSRGGDGGAFNGLDARNGLLGGGEW